MTLAEVPVVVVDISYHGKFIVGMVTDGGNSVNKLVVRAYRDCRYHRNIFAILQREVGAHGFGTLCLGGGMISIDAEKRTVSIYGFSFDYGEEPDREQTICMLRFAFPEFQVN